MAAPRPLDEPLTLPQLVRFWARVEREAGDGCWFWRGKLDHRGNPHCHVNDRTISARRLSWELNHPGDEPLSPRVRCYMTCRHSDCINPEHMDIRVGGGHIPAEKCRRGHDFTPENVYLTTQGKRACKECIRVGVLARRARYLKEGRGWGRTYHAVK